MAAAAKPDFIEMVLACGSWQKAQDVADSLLEKKLVTSVEFFDTLEVAKEVKLVVQCLAGNFRQVEAEAANG